MTKAGVFCTTIVRNYTSWGGCFDLARWGLMCFFEKDQKFETKFKTMDAGHKKTHTLSIEDSDGQILVKVDELQHKLPFVQHKETNFWAVENAIRRMLNDIHEQSPA